MDRNFSQQQIYSFKHWSRKSWSVFQSLKLQIRISVLTVSLLTSLLLHTSFAQTNHPNIVLSEQELDTIEIIGELAPELSSELARSIQVILSSKLATSPVVNLQDILQTASTIDLRLRGQQDIQADLSIRGSSFDQVQVLFNGMDITDPQSGHHSLNLPISLNQIHHLEILSGPGSRALGPNSYAGSVNFVSLKPKFNSLDFAAEIGDFGSYEASASISKVGKHVNHYFAINYASSHGYMNNTDFLKYGAYYYGELVKKKFEMNWQGAYSDKSFGANSFYTPKYPNQFEQLKNTFGALVFKTKGNWSSQTQLHYRANADRFELFRNYTEVPSWYINHNYHITKVLQFNTKVWHWSQFGKTTLALNARNENIMSNILGISMNDTLVAWYDNDAFYTKQDSRTYLTFSAEQVYRWNLFKIAAGVMYYFYPSENQNNGFFPGVDLSYFLSPDWKLSCSINTGMRLPTFTDLYYEGPSNIGNPNLLPETQISYEIGADYHRKNLEISANFYINIDQNSIDWVRYNDTLKWQPINVTQVNTRGFDLSANYSFNSKWLQNIGVQYTFLDKKASSNDYQSHYVMDYLKNKLVIVLNHKVYRKISLGYQLQYNQRMGEYLNYNISSNISESVNYEPYTLLNIRLSWKSKSWLIYADLKNAMNVSYQDYGNLLQPGRWFSVGFKKQIK